MAADRWTKNTLKMQGCCTSTVGVGQPCCGGWSCCLAQHAPHLCERRETSSGGEGRITFPRRERLLAEPCSPLPSARSHRAGSPLLSARLLPRGSQERRTTALMRSCQSPRQSPRFGPSFDLMVIGTVHGGLRMTNRTPTLVDALFQEAYICASVGNATRDYNSSLEVPISAELIPVQSPFLRESYFVSFPPLTYMFKFSGFAHLMGLIIPV